MYFLTIKYCTFLKEKTICRLVREKVGALRIFFCPPDQAPSRRHCTGYTAVKDAQYIQIYERETELLINPRGGYNTMVRPYF